MYCMYMYVHHRPTDTEIPITNRYSVRTCILHNIIRTHVRASRGMHINVYIPLLVYPELGSTVMLPLHQVHELIIRIRGLNTTVITGHHAQTHVHTHTHTHTPGHPGLPLCCIWRSPCEASSLGSWSPGPPGRWPSWMSWRLRTSGSEWVICCTVRK